jgi:DNA-binding PadR family transcriptional regulator
MRDRRYSPMSETMFHILLALRDERHGYGIMQHVADLTDGRIVLGAGTVYMSLGKLESDGLVKVTSRDGRRTNYLITPKGTEVLRAEARRIAELYRYAKEIS